MSARRWALLVVPVALGAAVAPVPAVARFALSALAIIPLSALLGEATEHLAAHAGPTAGGLLNATLGNLAELIIGTLALRAGLVDLVKASITGSVLGNLLLVLGAAQLAGGLRHHRQTFSRQLAGMNVALLVIAALGLIIPALFHAAHPDPARAATVRMSEFVAMLLIIGYGLSLVYSMGTHRGAFAPEPGPASDAAAAHAPGWSVGRAIAVLIAAAAAVGVLSEVLVGATEAAARVAGLSEFFVGLIVVPIIGNAAEHSSAVMMALRNRMDLAVGIAIGSSVQVALLIAPLLVFVGVLVRQPMDLAFSTFEVASVAMAVWVASVIAIDGESNWLEGALLLIVYAMLAVAFFFF